MSHTIKDLLNPNLLVGAPTQILDETRREIYVNAISTCSGFTKHVKGSDVPVLREERIARLTLENQKRVRDDYDRLVNVYKYADEKRKELIFVIPD